MPPRAGCSRASGAGGRQTRSLSGWVPSAAWGRRRTAGIAGAAPTIRRSGRRPESLRQYPKPGRNPAEIRQIPGSFLSKGPAEARQASGKNTTRHQQNPGKNAAEERQPPSRPQPRRAAQKRCRQPDVLPSPPPGARAGRSSARHHPNSGAPERSGKPAAGAARSPTGKTGPPHETLPNPDRKIASADR